MKIDARLALGAFLATAVLGTMADWTASENLLINLLAVLPAMLVAMGVAGAVGYAFERVIIRPVYGQHLKQILITMGGMIVGEELIKVIWGPAQIPLPLPGGFRGALLIGEAAIEAGLAKSPSSTTIFLSATNFCATATDWRGSLWLSSKT